MISNIESTSLQKENCALDWIRRFREKLLAADDGMIDINTAIDGIEVDVAEADLRQLEEVIVGEEEPGEGDGVDDILDDLEEVGEEDNEEEGEGEE